MGSFANTCNDTATNQVCIDDMLTISRTMHDSFLDMFSTIRIRIDPDLRGKDWHVAVSEKLWKEIIEHEKKEK
ncbi:hypothetical protein LCGC14_1907600 [marine sediment metagenome]|uniref:Uncharacterized protein n=1 Tax=marine sediment metagenome TaxID=412755 RepID=A0A0F9FV36_9ZZZZ